MSIRHPSVLGLSPLLTLRHSARHVSEQNVLVPFGTRFPHGHSFPVQSRQPGHLPNGRPKPGYGTRRPQPGQTRLHTGQTSSPGGSGLSDLQSLHLGFFGIGTAYLQPASSSARMALWRVLLLSLWRASVNSRSRSRPTFLPSGPSGTPAQIVSAPRRTLT